MTESQLLESAVSEYDDLLLRVEKKTDDQSDIDLLVKGLSQSHDWTERGAREIVKLTKDYGKFMLRNALALSIILEKEDGDFGY